MADVIFLFFAKHYSKVAKSLDTKLLMYGNIIACRGEGKRKAKKVEKTLKKNLHTSIAICRGTFDVINVCTSSMWKNESWATEYPDDLSLIKRKRKKC